MHHIGTSILACTLLSLVPGCLGDDVDARVFDDASSRASPQSAPGAVAAAQGGLHENGLQPFVLSEIGHPVWMPVDLHQFSSYMGPNFEGFLQLVLQLLPSPEHEWHDALGIGPGAPHLLPYESEFATHFTKLGLEDGVVFSESESGYSNGIFHIFMVVPTDDAPLGSSPDFQSGPIIPHAVFPIHTSIDFHRVGLANPMYHEEFDVPALDAITPGWDVDGHSHFPMFVGHQFPSESLVGRHRVEVTMTDVVGNGWKISASYLTRPDAAGANDSLRASAGNRFEVVHSAGE